jgi:hypothetical protein
MPISDAFWRFETPKLGDASRQPLLDPETANKILAVFPQEPCAICGSLGKEEQRITKIFYYSNESKLSLINSIDD